MGLGFLVQDKPVHVLLSQMAECVSQVELSVSCSNLLDKDVGSKSDPLCVLLQKTADDKWTEVNALFTAEP